MMARQILERAARKEERQKAGKEKDRQEMERQIAARDRASAEAGLGVRMQAFSAIAGELAETPKIVEEDARAVE